MKLKNLNTKTGNRGLGSFVTKCLTTCILLLTLSLGAFAQQVTMEFVWVPSAGTSTTADFDVVLKNTGAVPLTFNGIIIRSLGHTANTTILTGGIGTISWKSVPGTAPTSVASGNGWNNWPNLATNLGYTSATRILNYSSSNTFFTNATAPTIPTGAGVNIGRFRMTVTGGTFVQGTQFGFNWATTAAVIAYVNGAATTTSLATAGTNKIVTVSSNQPLGPVAAGPTASVLSGSASICNGASTNLSVAVTGGTAPYTVTVTDGTSNFTATGSSPVSISVSPTSTKTYSIVSVDGGGTGTGNTGSATVTVTNPSDNVTTVTECNSYTWAHNGQTYTTSGIYTGTTTNCVTEKLDLTITTPTDNVTTVSQCGGSYTWANNGQTYTASGIYTGTTTNCVTEKLDLTISGGGMALTSAGSSVTGSSSATVTLNNVSELVYNSTCDYIATVTDGPTGSGAGTVTVGVVVAPSNTVSSINGQVYAKRSFNINAANAETGSVTLYATQSDFNTYNSNAGTLLQMNATTVKIAQVINGLTGTVVPVATTAIYNSTTSRYEITGNVPNLSGEYYLYTSPACALTMSTINVGTMVANQGNNTYKVPLTWSAVPGAVSYDIRFRKVGTSTWTNFATTNLSRLLSGLLSSTSYEFQGKVRCSSNTASGLWGTLGTFTTPAPLIVCTSPSTVNVTNVTATSAKFAWTSMGSPTSSYMLRYRVVGASTWTNCGVNSNSKVIGGLTAGTNYEAQVASYCLSNNSYGAFTSSSTFTTVSAPTCAAPTNFAFVSATGTTATLSWTNNTGTTQYIVSVRVAGSSSSYLNYCGTSNPRHIGGLTPNTQYEAYLRGYCSATHQYTTATALINFNTGAMSKAPAGVELPEGINNEVKLYPNPTSNELNIEFLSDNQSTTSIKVMDMSGRVVKQTQSVSFEGLNTINVSLSELTAGMYTIQVVNNDKLVHIGRITKN